MFGVSFLYPLFLVGAPRRRDSDRAAPVPPPHRDGGRLSRRAPAAEGAGRAAAAAPAARADSAGAARRGAGAAGVCVRAAVFRERRRRRRLARHHRRARHVDEPVGARSVRRWRGRPRGAPSTRRPPTHAGRAGDVRRCRDAGRAADDAIAAACCAAIDAARPGAGGTRFRTALGARGGSDRRRRRAASSSSPICSRRDGKRRRRRGARRHRRRGRRSAPAGRATSRSPPCGARARPWSPPFTTSARARPACRCACELDGRELATERVDVAPQSAAEVRLVAPLPPRGGVEVAIDDAAGLSGRQRALSRARSGHARCRSSSSPPTRRARRAPACTSSARSASPDDGRAFQRARARRARRFPRLTPRRVGQPGGAHRARDAARSIAQGRERDRRVTCADGGRVLLTLGPDVDLDTLDGHASASTSGSTATSKPRATAPSRSSPSTHVIPSSVPS